MNEEDRWKLTDEERWAMEAHVQEVHAWVKENVMVYETPRTIRLWGVHMDEGRFRGHFKLSLDGEPVLERYFEPGVGEVLVPAEFSFGLGGNGKPN